MIANMSFWRFVILTSGMLTPRVHSTVVILVLKLASLFCCLLIKVRRKKTISKKMFRSNWGCNVAQLEECLLSLHEAVSSILSLHKPDMIICACDFSTCGDRKVRSSRSRVQSKF